MMKKNSAIPAAEAARSTSARDLAVFSYAITHHGHVVVAVSRFVESTGLESVPWCAKKDLHVDLKQCDHGEGCAVYRLVRHGRCCRWGERPCVVHVHPILNDTLCFPFVRVCLFHSMLYLCVCL